MRSTHTATLNLPNLPTGACEAHIFKELASGSLVSIGQLCDGGCIATFDRTTIKIFHQEKVVLIGYRNFNTGLWEFDIGSNTTASMNNIQQPPSLVEYSCNFVASSKSTIADRIAFLHAASGSPALSTWIQAIDLARTHNQTSPTISPQLRSNDQRPS
jgi:hypothetical protein